MIKALEKYNAPMNQKKT